MYKFLLFITISIITIYVVWSFYACAPVVYKGRGYCSPTSEYIHPKSYPQFLTETERKYILQTAEPMFRKSTVVNESMPNVRQSYTAWLPKTDSTIKSIIQRVCDITNIPFENAEKVQVVKYDPNGYYKPHYDASCDDRKECVEFEKNGGQRVLTMIIYLNDDYEGGHTHFPRLDTKYKLASCDALLFYSLEQNGNKCHPLSLHAGTPVISGHKYIANIWLRESNYDVNK